MSVHMIYYKDGAKMMRPVLSREEYLKLRNSGFQVQNVARIRQGDQSLKSSLVQMNYSCLPNYDGTLKSSTRMTTTVGMDIDHVKAEDMQMVKEGILAKKDELGLKMLELSARGAGYHLVFTRRPELTQEENLRWASELLSVKYDDGAKDITRVFFTTTASAEDLLYLDDTIFQIEEADTQGTVPQCSAQKEFKGIPYTSIIAEWWHRNGGEPAEGERNVKLHKLAVNLRAICDNKKEVLMQIMPRFGLSDAELRSVVDSACKEPPKGISKMMQSIVDALEMGISSDEIEDADEVAAANSSLFTIHSSLKKLPIGLKESLAGVPVSMHMPVLCSVLPLAAAYADQVEVRYCDGEMQKLGMMSIIYGEQASGKSVCKHAVNIWKRQFDEEDALARKREDEWKERKKSRKANEKAPEDPKVLIRMVPVTVSCSTLLKRFKNANGHCIYSFGEELDTLRKTNGAGSWSSKYDIYRLSFDQGEWGQDYNSDQAESGVVKVAYNWTMLGTNGAMRKCFKSDNIENGLSSRILVAEMPDSSFSKMPKFGRRSAEDEARIQQAVTRLRAFSGLIDTPRLRKAIEEWVELKRVEAAKDIDHVKDTYRKRAAVIGFRCGVIFHLLEITQKEPSLLCKGREKAAAKTYPKQGRKEGSACIKFALMMAEYCLQQQMKAFGEALRNEYISAQDECQRYGANHSVFDQLAPTFSRDDLRALKSGTTESGLRNIVMRWKRDGWIVPIDRHHWQKTSQCPIVPTSH